MKSDFVKCGILGWCIEIIWTAFHGMKSKNNKFIGYTSIIMFPIYGLASVIKPISLKLKKMKMPTIIRGIVYSIGIFMVELITGSILKKTNNCPWDYSDKKCLTQNSAEIEQSKKIENKNLPNSIFKYAWKII